MSVVKSCPIVFKIPIILLSHYLLIIYILLHTLRHFGLRLYLLKQSFNWIIKYPAKYRRGIQSTICSNFQFCLTFAIFKSLVRFSAKEYYVSNFMFIDLHSSPAMAAIFWYFLVTTIGPWLTVNFSDFPIQSWLLAWEFFCSTDSSRHIIQEEK